MLRLQRHRFKWWFVVVPALLLSGLILGFGVVTSRDRPIVAAIAPARLDRLPGQSAFWAGLNYPWKTGQDFGTGGWGHSGVSDATTYQEIDADFANMAAQGVRVVKWRVFSDGRYGLHFSSDGDVTGVDDLLFPDIDAALDI